jgi:RNA polymerase sigma factor FliA
VLDDAGRALVEEFAIVARSVAWEFWRKAPRADVEELEGIALVALAEAVERYPSYCADRGYDPARRDFMAAYVTRRMRGAILDWARSQDWVTRGQRRTLKLLRDAARPGASAAELAEAAEAAGLPGDEVRAALAAEEAGRSLRLDDAFTDSAGWGTSLTDPAADVESVAAVQAMLGAAARALGGLPLEQQLVVVRRYMNGDELKDIAEALGVTRDRAAQLHETAVIALHEAMVQVASEGCACNGSCSCSAGPAGR